MANFLELVSFRWVHQAAWSSLARLLAGYGTTTDALWITASELTVASTNRPDRLEDWQVLVAQNYRVLVLKQTQREASRPDQVSIGLSFDATAIATFLTWVENGLEAGAVLAPMLQAQLPQAQAWLSASAPAMEGFVLDLLNVMVQNQPGEGIANSSSTSEFLSDHPHFPIKPAQHSLNQQIEQRLLLDQVITKIRQSLELPEILQTTVDEVRQFLKADRLVIYQFEGQVESQFLEQVRPRGVIAYEARIDEMLPSILNYAEDDCFGAKHRIEGHTGDREQLSHANTLRPSQPKAVVDVQQTYQSSPCLLKVLNQAQVRSKLVVSIETGDRPWGLLIAHQCTEQRQWQPWEVEFLQHIGEHLSVAISQAELYHQLQQQKRSLEVCVIERTEDLQDAMISAQSASRAKSEFLATMSHELRTPLTCIIGMSATLLRWSFGDLSSRQQNYLTTIHDSGERLLSLINDILEVAKIESGRTILEVSDFSLSSLTRQCLEVFQDKARHQGVELFLDLKLSAQQDNFVADPRRIKQILQNLLSNAVKFTPQGGEVKLRVWRENHAAVVFRIEDTGIGIPDTQQVLLFEKFQQLEPTRHRQYQGTGLGLALTKQLVELHGGSISVESKLNYGSAFTVRLPLQQLSPQKTLPTPSKAVAPEPILGRIVLVEDQEETAGIICDMLTAADHQVIWVVDGSQVVEQVGLLQPMAVIIDMGLSGANGHDIVVALRQTMATASVKILALAEDETKIDAAASTLSDTGGQDFSADEIILKPVNPEILLVKINALMSLPIS
ncbi:MAG: ATP-binding protein [Cyanobacteria bacterium P01_A01_bin.123]